MALSSTQQSRRTILQGFRTRALATLREAVAHVPPSIGNPLADRVGDLVYVMARRSRRSAISNLRHAMGPVPRYTLKQAVRGVFRNVMRNYYDLCRAPDLTEEQIDPAIDFDERGWQRIAELNSRKQGVILVGAHFGGFDLR